jgi:hypothetical protein
MRSSLLKETTDSDSVPTAMTGTRLALVERSAFETKSIKPARVADVQDSCTADRSEAADVPLRGCRYTRERSRAKEEAYYERFGAARKPQMARA